MPLVDTLTEAQKNDLIELRKKYVEYLAKHGETAFIRDRVMSIDKELREHEKPIKQNYFG